MHKVTSPLPSSSEPAAALCGRKNGECLSGKRSLLLAAYVSHFLTSLFLKNIYCLVIWDPFSTHCIV